MALRGASLAFVGSGAAAGAPSDGEPRLVAVHGRGDPGALARGQRAGGNAIAVDFAESGERTIAVADTPGLAYRLARVGARHPAVGDGEGGVRVHDIGAP